MAPLLVGTSEGLFLVTGQGGPSRIDDQPVVAMANPSAPDRGGVVSVLDASGRVGTVALAKSETLVRKGRVDLGSDAPTTLLDAGRLFIGTRGAHLFRQGDDGGFDRLASYDAVPGRSSWTQPWGAPPDTRSLAWLPGGADGGSILVNAHVGGVCRSDDGGESWVQLLDPGIDVHQVAAAGSGLLVVATGVSGFGWSVDRGDSWRFTDAGLHAEYCRAVAVTVTSVLVSASTGPFDGKAALYRRALGVDDPAVPFEKVEGGLPEWFDGNIDTNALATHGSEVALLAEDGSLFVSTDDARTWRSVGRVPGPATSLVFAHP